MDRQSLGNKVDICQIGSVGMYYHFYYIAFFLQVYKKKSMAKFFLKCDANVGQNWKQFLMNMIYAMSMVEFTCYHSWNVQKLECCVGDNDMQF